MRKESNKWHEAHGEQRLRNQPIPSLVFSMSVPIMFSLLIQALYNVVDSIYVASYSERGLTALSLAFPLQLILTAVANGTGTGTGLLISRSLGAGEPERAKRLLTHGILSAIVACFLTSAALLLLLNPYYHRFSYTPEVAQLGNEYGTIVIMLSGFLFLESVCTRAVQARGNTLLPMMYQSLGAVVNIVLDPVLIFGAGPIAPMGIRGAAIATVLGQAVSMLCALVSVTRHRQFQKCRICPAFMLSIYQAGLPTMLGSGLVSAYIIGLNGVLIRFSEYAVTSLGIYYKIQTFLLMPTYGLEQGILPVLSYNLGAKENTRVWKTFQFSLAVSSASLILGTIGTNVCLDWILDLFSAGPELRATAIPALHRISLAFPFFGVTILIPALLQASGRLRQCLSVVILRQVILLVPLAFLLSLLGLNYTWLTFPISEIVAAILCLFYLRRFSNVMKQTGEIKLLASEKIIL